MKFSLYIPTADPLSQDGLSRRSSCGETLYSYWEERGGRDQVKVNAKGWKKGDSSRLTTKDDTWVIVMLVKA
jgi:hypothetical protein